MKKLQTVLLLLMTISLQAQDVVINEIVPKNVNSLQDRCERSGCPDWIELYNTTGSDIDISNYYLSDDPDNPTKWQVPMGTVLPANDYLIIFAENARSSLTFNLITNFRLSREGETIVLSNASGVAIQTVTYPSTPTDIAYGRLSNGTYSLLSESTPRAQNIDNTAFEFIDSDLTVSIPSGVYATAQTVSLSHTGTGTIYYTLDGSPPSMSAIQYTSPIVVSANTILKAIVIENQQSFSIVENRSYIIGATHDLPIVLLSTDNSSMPALRSNKQIIDGRVEFSFIETDGTTVINQYADFREAGNASRLTIPQINGKIEASKFYGDKDFDHKMYPNKDIDEFNSFLLRNAGQDWFYSRLRDAFVSRLMSKDGLTDFPFEGYRPAVLYVNAEYRGITNIREDNDSDYIRHNFNLKDDEFVRQGRRSGYIQPTDPLPADREELDKLINFNNYTNINLLYNYTTLGEIGFTWWIDLSGKTGQRYHYNIHDYDVSLGNARSFVSDLSGFPMDVTSLLDDEIEGNIAYKNEALQFVATAINHLYNTDRALTILNELEAEIESEITRQGQENTRLNNAARRPTNNDLFEDLAKWKEHVAVLRNNIRSLIDADIFNRIQAEYSLDTPIEVSYASSDINHGFVKVHNIKILKQSDKGNYFSNIPLKLTAEALPGYRFVRWDGDASGTNLEINPVFSGNATITAVFEAIPVVTNAAFINEVQSKNDATIADENGDFDDWIEIYNPTLSPIDLAGLYFSDSPSNPLKHQIPDTNSSKTTVPANGYLLLWADNETSQGENHLGFKLKGTDEVIVTYADGVTEKQRVEFIDLDSDESYGAESDGSSNFIVFTSTTPNATNATTLSVEENVLPLLHEFIIYPNPTTSSVEIKTKAGLEEVSWEVYTITGILVNSGIGNNVNMETLSNGVYLVKINNGAILKIVKE